MSDTQFWNSHYKRFDVFEPSAFVKFCVDQWIAENDTVIEIGCGNGRDGMFLAEHCREYFAVDASAGAIDQFSKKVEGHDARTRMHLHCGNVADFDFKQCIPQDGGRIVLYSRFSLHSLDEATELFVLNEFLKLGANNLFAIEARTIFDPLFGVGNKVGRNAYVTDHYRRFIDPRDLLNFAMENSELQYFILSNGFAVTTNEDPIVLRTVLQSQQ